MALALAACGGGESTDPTPTAGTGGLDTSDYPEELQEIIEAAEEERIVNIRTSAMTDQEKEALEDMFAERFGFTLEIERFIQHPSDYVTLLAQEARAGEVQSDVAKGASVPNMLPTIDEGGMQQVDWMGTFGPLFDDAGQAQLQRAVDATDPSIVEACLVDTTNILPFVFNPSIVSREDMPTTWDELLDPQYSGLIAGQDGGFPFGTLSLSWGEEATLEYARALRDNDIRVVRGGSAGIIEALNAGEVGIGAGVSIVTTLEAIEEGAPLDFIFPSDIYPYFDVNLCALDGPRPNMATLFLAWYATEGRPAISGPPIFAMNLIDEGGYLQELFAEQSLGDTDSVTFVGPEDIAQRTDVRGKVLEIWTGVRD
ncbi:MAG: ABC transporter substrate-binding protein [Nitrospirales bacterium]